MNTLMAGWVRAPTLALMTQIASSQAPGRRLAVLAAAAATILLWGSAFVAIRPTARSLGFQSLVSARLLLASAVFAVVARPLHVRRLALRELPLVAAIGFSGLVAYQLLLSAGESRTPAGVSAMIFASAPVLVVLLARITLRERLDRRRWLGVAIALAGAALVATTQGVERGGSLGGALLVLAAVCCYAPWMILTKLAARRIPAYTVAAWSTWLAALMMLPFSTAVPGDVALARPSALVGVLYLGLIVTTVPLVLWTWVLSRVAASAASSTLLLIGPSAVLASWLVLGEAPAALALVGGGLTLGGVAVAQLPAGRAIRVPVTRRERPRHAAAEAAA